MGLLSGPSEQCFISIASSAWYVRFALFTVTLAYDRVPLPQDCGDVVASKFFPIEGPDGKQHPLCERDYFRRLNLICAKCGMALRGSYITACSTPIPNPLFHRATV